MIIPYVMRKCTKCGEWLVASSVNFYKDKKGKYGLKGWCKKCVAEYDKQYREANKESRRKHNKQYRETHREAIAEYKRRYREQNKEAEAERSKKYREQNKKRVAEYRKQYYEQNKEAEAEHSKKYRKSPQGQVIKFNSHNKRRAKEQAQGRGITSEQWLECMSFFNWQCAYSGEYLGGKDNQSIRSLDHIEPLNKGGANEPWNIVPMYRAYNSSKNDKDLLEWYTEQPYFSQDRLDKIYEWQEYAFNKWGIDTEAQ